MGSRAQAREETRPGDLGSQRGAVEGRGREAAEDKGRREDRAPTLKLCRVLARTLRHFFPDWESWLGSLDDPRDEARTVYTAPFLVMSGVLMFLTKLGARRQIKYAFGTSKMLANLNRLAGAHAKKIEHPDTLEYTMKRMAPRELSVLRVAMARRLIRMKCLDRWRLFGRFLVVIDATGHLVFKERHCEHCLILQRGISPQRSPRTQRTTGNRGTSRRQRPNSTARSKGVRRSRRSLRSLR